MKSRKKKTKTNERKELDSTQADGAWGIYNIFTNYLLPDLMSTVLGIFFRYFYLFATQLHYLKMPKEKKNVGRDGEEA